MKTQICNYLSEMIPEVSAEEFGGLLEIPPEEKMGDYALPCFTLAKKLRKNPALIAEEIAGKLGAVKPGSVNAMTETSGDGNIPEDVSDSAGAQEKFDIVKVESVGAYCNIFLNREKYAEKCLQTIKTANLGVSQPGAGRTICMDYSSPNIAKNFHVGHLRTTVIGNSLYKIYEKLGYNVVRINHLGDWGTQFGKLIVAYKLWSSKEQVEADGIGELLRIYVKFNDEAERRPELMEEARKWFVKMEQNDTEALEIWEWFKEISMVEFERVYKLLGISFDSYLGESFYRDKVPALVKELEEKRLLTESQGARVVDLEAYNMPPCLITKSDGGSIYHSRDIAAVLYRKREYDFTKCLYVTGLEQSLHFKQVFKAVEVMGYDWTDGLVHVPYGLVSLAGEKLSTRSGNIIYAEDILKEAIERAETSIQEKNPDLKDKEATAKMVGVGAIIFHDLFNQRIKNVEFSWKEVLSFEGSTGPYAQYTYARAKSILRKAGATEAVVSDNAAGYNLLVADMIDYSLLTDDVTYSLVKTLQGYEDAVLNAADKYEPSIVARYIIALATRFNKFYHECPILQADEATKQARLAVTDAVQTVLKDACGLLGMECPEEM